MSAFAGGSGTVGDPYLIADWEQLRNIELNMGSYFALVNDIDCSGAGNWHRVPFGGSKLDGRGHLVHGVFIAQAVTNDRFGLFETIITGGEIRRIAVDLLASAASTHSFSGSLAGAIESALVEDCLISGGFRGGSTSSMLMGVLSANTGSTIRRVVTRIAGAATNVFVHFGVSTPFTFENNYRLGYATGTVTAGQATHVTANIGLEATYPGLDFTNTWQITPIGPRLRPVPPPMTPVSARAWLPTHGGVAATRVVVLRVSDGQVQTSATPDAQGYWTVNLPDGEYMFLYYKDTCGPPIAHGPYNIVVPE